MNSPRDITLFIDLFSYHFLRDRLFDPSIEKFNGDNILAPWLYLRNWFTRRGVEVQRSLARREKGPSPWSKRLCRVTQV